MAHEQIAGRAIARLYAPSPSGCRWRRARGRYSLVLLAAAIAVGTCTAVRSAGADEQRVAELEAQLRAAQARVGELEETLAKLTAEVADIKSASQSNDVSKDTIAPPPEPDESGDLSQQQRVAILVPDLGADERDKSMKGRPELFLQTGYAADPIEGAGPDDAVTRFTLNRLEARWSGRVSERLGMGFEIQYNPAPEGAAEELVNDAFVEYYATDAVTVRAGQFVKPFGFDVQHSSSDRESPERAMFAGYFFPGQRDRGLMLSADLSRAASWLDGATLQAGVLNGNRFFDDDNDALNTNVRFRKALERRPFAFGVSLQTGSQLLPPGTTGSDRATLYGADAQWVFGRLGLRAEYVRGTTPSTLLSLDPEFAAAFEPGAETWGAAALFDYRISADDQVYWRWDRLEHDPATAANVRAFNVGYLRRLGESSRVGFDYQRKDDVTFNDDELNTQLTFRWNLVY